VGTAATEALRARLVGDPDVDLVSLRTSTDKSLSIGQDVWRLRWRGHLATAVAADADLHTTCGALLDVLATLEDALADERSSNDPLLDLTSVSVLVERPLPGSEPTEVALALRSMRDAVLGVNTRIWYRDSEVGWTADGSPAPVWPEDDPVVSGWVADILLPRLKAQPSALALDLVETVGDPSIQLYPAPITSKTTGLFALRLDGLQIGTVSATVAQLSVGKPGKLGDGPQRLRLGQSHSTSRAP
jgi:hypothetical protein